MDPKTGMALVLTKALYDQIRDLSDNAAASIESLENPKLSFVTGDVLRSQIVCANIGDYYQAVSLDESERAEIAAVLRKYHGRINEILSGCSLKLSPAINEMIRQGEKFRQEMRLQAVGLSAEKGKRS